MMPYFSLFLFLLFSINQTFSQDCGLEIQVIEVSSQKPLIGAHVFINGTTIGGFTNQEGIICLNNERYNSEPIIITHLAFKTLVLTPEKFQNSSQIIVELEHNGIQLDEIKLTAKRGKNWKKNYKKFRSALLGKGRPEAKCTILNPEVLRFNEENGRLSVSAIDLLEIQNEYLGYSINFWLEELIIEADGSTSYVGYGQFLDLFLTHNKKINKLRKKHYGNSMAHFLRSLIKSKSHKELKSHGYEIILERFNMGRFTTIGKPEPIDVFEKDSLTGLYKLKFSEFLTVRHLKQKVIQSSDQSVTISETEQQKFGDGREQAQGVVTNYAISRLYKVEPYVLFDSRGNIINKSAVKEYGFWANQRLATTLPLFYESTSNVLESNSFVETEMDTLQVFVNFMSPDIEKKEEAFSLLDKNWSASYMLPLLDILSLTTNPWQKSKIQELIKNHTEYNSLNYYTLIKEVWNDEPTYGSYYPNFKAQLYQSIDPMFFDYFNQRYDKSLIRFDEIMWGGVKQDGIPPLRSPIMIDVQEADYLEDSDVVFGLVVNGEAYAYPKRILAWHEFFTDRIQDMPIAGVYCTLCGTIIVYKTTYEGQEYNLGTSGFLYRSNKLMYDKKSQSLWSTILGKPVVGPLTTKGIELEVLPVETTTWGEWKGRYPLTKVTSLNTGHKRNYDEGEAYKEYFATDNLMFPVPIQDNRLFQKDEVFIPRTSAYEKDPLAISKKYLKKNKWHQDVIAENGIVALYFNGSCLAFETKNIVFNSFENGVLRDESGLEWTIGNEYLISTEKDKLQRIPSHESFWFAWINVYDTTRLIK